MKKVINVVAMISIVLIGYYYYGEYLNPADTDVTVSCTEDYDTDLNEMIIICDVTDPAEIISIENPLTLTLFSEDESIIEEKILDIGTNDIVFNNLEHSTSYTLKINGYEQVEEDLIAKEFYNTSFSTVSEDFITPVITISGLDVFDISSSFSIELEDENNSITEIHIVVIEGSVEILDQIATNIDTTVQIVDQLNELTDYTINIIATYKINDSESLTSTLHSFDISTLDTPDIPLADITIVSNDNVNLTINVVVSNEDATNVVYYLSLIDFSDNVLYSELLISNNVTIDISSISVDYEILVLGDFQLIEETMSDVVLDSFTINTNELSNFFVVPTLNLVDTSLPLDDYNDYDDYIYTHINNGETSFTINCAAPIDCTVLIDTPVYFDLPFNILGFLHPYYDTKSIGYSYTSTKIDITITPTYTQGEIDDINIAVNNIIDSIITESMTTEEKIKAAHDYVINTSSYDEDCFDDDTTCDNDHTAYGIFFDYNAVCEGYAHSMDILLRAMRIPSFRLSSQTHQWNVVFINGEWLHLDATWDDPVTSGGGSLLIYDYYLITTSILHTLDTSDTHTYDTTYSLFIN